jgi:LysM repeat protein
MERLTRLNLIGVLVMLTLLMASPAQASPPIQSHTTHVVAWGETLFSIARRYGTTVEAICAANAIASPSSIYAGQQLIIPSTDFGSTAIAPDVAAIGDTHVVGPGENLYRIALRYGTTIQTLAQLNGIVNPNHVAVGQMLRIPGVVTTPATTLQAERTTRTHTVQSGETLAIISMRYGIPTLTLAQVNAIPNLSLIFPGQVLIIPGGDDSASAATGTSGEKRVVVDISEQHLYAYQGETLVYSFVASTGMHSSPTRTGTFSVLNKIPSAYASTWNLQMPHWLGIYWSGGLQNGIHALPILSSGQQLWAGYLGTPISYGCIVLGTYEAQLLYEWVDVGTPVVIQR